MSSSLPPHLVYTCWASADEWQPGFVMLGANVCSIPVPPPFSEPVIGVDGFWGAHKWTVYPQPYRREFPYLAWIPLPQCSRSVLSVLTRPVEKTMWRPYPQKSDHHLINPDLFDELTMKWKSIKAALEESFNDISSEAAFSSVEWLMKAYTRAFEALGKLKKDFRAWGDFVAVFRNLQRLLLELCAFWTGGRMFTLALPFNPPFVCRLAVPSSKTSSLASYILIHKPTFVLDHTKEVQLSPRDLCSAQPLSLQPLVHSLHHWYYPLLVDNVVADLEIAARSYLKCSDLFRPTREFKRKLDKVENKKNEEAGRRAKKARTESAKHTIQLNHSEIRRLSAAGAAPIWFPKTQEVWMSAMDHVILYYLNSYHVYEEVKEMECLQFKTTFEKRWGSQEMAVNHIAEMWDPSGGGTDFKFFHNKKVWRTWLWVVREVVMDWEGFDSWDWVWSQMHDRGLACYSMSTQWTPLRT
ncbi:hypothetical protein EI94DRAFT_1698093 [Lactarius quietus]|nr:hypothetical protein EI94DRAFT_1698093 [Lactarius quietus]